MQPPVESVFAKFFLLTQLLSLLTTLSSTKCEEFEESDFPSSRFSLYDAQNLFTGQQKLKAKPLVPIAGGEPIVFEFEARRAENELEDEAQKPSSFVPQYDIFVLEEKDYPKFLFENYTGVGQVSGLTALPNNDLAILHRANREWNSTTFDSNHQVSATTNHGELSSSASLLDKNLISEDTIRIIDGDDGSSKDQFGANLFYLPHSIASDREGNLWVSDVAKHQIMRLPVRAINQLRSQKLAINETLKTGHKNLEPDIVLGEAFVPGNDSTHFCQPSEVQVSDSGELVYVADGYCNSRVMVFTGSGEFVKSIGDELGMNVVHSLALIAKRNLLCVADRENQRIFCFNAGLDGDLKSLGKLVMQVQYPLGNVYAILSIGPNHLLVSSKQANTNHYDVATLNLITGEIRQVWVSTDLIEPHSFTKTFDGYYVYSADISKGTYKKIFKFNVVRRELIA